MLVDVGNPNQVTGIACFALAAGACWYAARRASRVWRVLAWTQTAFCLEIVFNLRHRLHNFVDGVLESRSWYAERTPWQVVLLAMVAVVIVLGAPFVWRAARGDRPATVAMAAALVVFASFAVESVSLHDVDSLMYAPIGPLLAVVVGWIAASAVVIAAALVFARR